MSVFQHLAYFPLDRLARSQHMRARVRCVCVRACVPTLSVSFKDLNQVIFPIHYYSNICLRNHDFLNYEIGLFKMDIFIKLVITIHGNILCLN